MAWVLLGLCGPWVSCQCGWEVAVCTATTVWVLQLLQRLFKNNCIFLPVTLPVSCHPWFSVSHLLAPRPCLFLPSFILGLELNPHEIPSLPEVSGLTHPTFLMQFYLWLEGVSVRY